jgi:hypothetical protein
MRRVVVHPLLGAPEGVQLVQLSFGTAVRQTAPELVEHDGTHEQLIFGVCRVTKAHQDLRVAAKDLADRVRVEYEARYSGVARGQPHPSSTQHCVELVPPLLPAIIGA